MENAFCKMCVTVCEKFVPDEGVVAGYDNRIRDKSPAKCGVQITEMIFWHALVHPGGHPHSELRTGIFYFTFIAFFGHIS